MLKLIRTRRASRAAALIAGLTLASLAGAARAGEAIPPAEEGPKTVVKYLTCAGGLALAPTPFAAYAAFMVCVKTFLDEPR